MIRLSLSLTSLFLFSACQSAPVPQGETIGEAIRGQEIHMLATVQEAPAAHFEQTLLVEARVKAVCQKAGCWMQVEDGGQPALVRWETGCGGKYSFPKDAIGERILIQGSIYPKELSPEDAEHMQEEAGTDLDLPAKGYEMNATAVVMLDRK